MCDDRSEECYSSPLAVYYNKHVSSARSELQFFQDKHLIPDAVRAWWWRTGRSNHAGSSHVRFSHARSHNLAELSMCGTARVHDGQERRKCRFADLRTDVVLRVHVYGDLVHSHEMGLVYHRKIHPGGRLQSVGSQRMT